MTRREFVGATLASATALARGRDAESRPNVVMLFSDDQRFDTIGALGNREIRTPNLDALARRGCAFTHAFTMGGIHGALCIPSRAMLMTGRTLYRAPDTIAPDTPMWPEVFAEAGYTVGGMGKWHNDRRSFARAFRRGGPVFFGGMTDQSRVPVYDIDPSGGYQAGKERVERTHSSTLFTDSAIRFVRGHHGPEPFLLYVAYTSPHDPRTAPPPFDTMYDPDRLALPPSFMPEHPFDNGELKVRDELLAPFPRTPEVIRRHIADYYGIISHLDHEIGRLLAALDETGRGRDTIVIFAGDNGLALGRHGLMGKQSVYDHSLRVPLIMAGPGVPPGVRRHGLCYLLDVFPTVCDLTGVASPSTVEGRSLAPTMRSAREGLRPDLFLAYRNLQRSVRGERWKLIEYRVNGQSRTQLFDMKADPWEMRDLSDDPRRATEVSQLRRRLGEWQREVGDPMAGKW